MSSLKHFPNWKILLLSLLLQRWRCDNATLIRRRVKYFHINLCKYYLVLAVLVEPWMHSTIILFGWLVRIKSMQEDDGRRWKMMMMMEDDDGRWWCKKMMMEESESASLVIWWSPWKEVIDSSHAPSILSTPPDHQLEDLTLKSPAINSEWGLKLLRCTISCSKVLMKYHTRRLIGWVIDKDLLCKISDR